ncbi:MAG: hypothetical protein JNM88_08780 [Chitinophagaceae bacterium]|nr:hypothetical protein [Chitinophagaceae bacterium]
MNNRLLLIPAALLFIMGFHKPVITDEEKAIIAEEFLLAKTISLSQAKNCDAYKQSMQLMEARSVIRGLFNKTIKTPARMEIIGSLQYNLQLLRCKLNPPITGSNLSDPPKPEIIKVGPGGVVTGNVPLDAYLFSILNKEQRKSLEESLSPEGIQGLKEFEKEYKSAIKKFEEANAGNGKWGLQGNDKFSYEPKEKNFAGLPIDIDRLSEKTYGDSLRKANKVIEY